MMTLSPAGVYALAHHEGVVLGPYLDSVGVWTFGIGHTGVDGVNPATMPKGHPPDRDAALREVFDLFRRDIARYEAEVSASVHVPLAQHEFDALVSFHYNTGGIARATLTRKLNAGDRDGSAAAFMGWSKPAQIIPRRRAEQALFRDGTYPPGAVPVYSVTASNRPGRVIRSLSRADVAALVAKDAAMTDLVRAGQAFDAAPPVHPDPRPAPAPAASGGLLAAILSLFRRK